MDTLGMFFACVAVGFLGQLIDGSLGMAYGVSCNTFLLALGFPPQSVVPACMLRR